MTTPNGNISAEPGYFTVEQLVAALYMSHALADRTLAENAAEARRQKLADDPFEKNYVTRPTAWGGTISEAKK